MSRPLDPIWEALSECFGEALTPRERGRRNVAVRELREAEATPEQIRVAYGYCRRNFTTFTEIAVCAHFSRAQHEGRGVNLLDELKRRREQHGTG